MCVSHYTNFSCMQIHVHVLESRSKWNAKHRLLENVVDSFRCEDGIFDYRWNGYAFSAHAR